VTLSAPPGIHVWEVWGNTNNETALFVLQSVTSAGMNYAARVLRARWLLQTVTRYKLGFNCVVWRKENKNKSLLPPTWEKRQLSESLLSRWNLVWCYYCK